MKHRALGAGCVCSALVMRGLASASASAAPSTSPPPSPTPQQPTSQLDAWLLLPASWRRSLAAPAVSRHADGSLALNPALLACSVAVAFAVPGVLFLASRAATRAARVEDVIAATEAAVSRHALVRANVGLGVYAAGEYSLAVDSRRAVGHVLLTTAPGHVRGVAVLEAVRLPGARTWTFKKLETEFDKGALDAWRTQQRATALARYGEAAVAAADASAGGPPPSQPAVSGGDDGLVLKLNLA